MPHLTTNQLRRIAERLGHTDIHVEASRGVFRLVCSCGYQSTRRQTEVEAAKTGIWHLRKVVADVDGLVNMNGIPLARAVEIVRMRRAPAASPQDPAGSVDTPAPAAVAG